MAPAKFLSYSVIVLVFLVAIAIAVLSATRVSAYFILFPEKNRLVNPLKTKGEVERVLTAIDAAISRWDNPGYFYTKERVLGEQTRNLFLTNRKEFYVERIKLIESGLVRGAIEPYKLARLARLHVLSDSDYKIGLAALKLSVDTGGNVRRLYMSRLKTLCALWQKLSKAEQKDLRPVIMKAVKYDRRKLIKFAKTNFRVRVMVREALKNNPAAYLQYVRDYLRP